MQGKPYKMVVQIKQLVVLVFIYVGIIKFRYYK